MIDAGNTDVLSPAQVWGQPEITDELKVFVNVGLDLGENKEFYMFGNYAEKHVDGGFFFRNPNTRGGVFAFDSDGDDSNDTRLVADLTTDGSGNWAAYVDLEADVTDDLLLGLAVRYEDFEDFSTTTNFKVSAHWQIVDEFAVRETVSTGFHAPSPGQSNTFNVTTEFIAGQLRNNGTIPSYAATGPRMSISRPM